MTKKIKLTLRNIEGYKPAKKDYFIWDSDILGFGLKVNRGGNKTYIVQTRLEGRSRRFLLGRNKKQRGRMGFDAFGRGCVKTPAIGYLRPTLSNFRTL